MPSAQGDGGRNPMYPCSSYWKQRLSLFALVASYLAPLVAVSACKPGDDTGPTAMTPLGSTLAIAANISAPQLISPTRSSELNDARPTLTVENATVTDNSTVSYFFQVAADREFSDVVAATEEGIPEDPSGRTSWQVSPPLVERQYFWRARAVNERGVAGPYSTPEEFTVSNAGLLISDSLMSGMSVGDASGGQFISQGWRVTRNSDFIRYEVPTITTGYVEFETTGLQTGAATDNTMLFGMWDASAAAGPYRTNAYRVHIQKLDATSPPPFLRLRWIANGEQHDTGANIEIWDPGRVYRWRLEWGAGPLGNAVQVFLDDVPIILQQYTREYSPKTHWIELGIEQRRQSVVGAVYSNVRIGSR